MSNPIGNDNHTYTRSSSAPSDIREKGTGNGNGNIIQNKKNSGICEQSYSMGYEQGKMKALEVVATALREIDEEHERHKHKMYDIICRLSNQLNNL